MKTFGKCGKRRCSVEAKVQIAVITTEGITPILFCPAHLLDAAKIMEGLYRVCEKQKAKRKARRSK